MRKLLSIILLVAIGGGGFGVWYYFIRNDEPAKLTQTERTVDKGATSGPDGAYAPSAGAETAVRFRINEKFGPLSHVAVIESTDVTGTFALAGTSISTVDLTVGLSALKSIDEQPPGVPGVGNRINFLKDKGLETAKFPTATFKLTAPISLPSAPVKGANVTVQAPGELTVHGVTKPVTIPITASWNGSIIDISGNLDIALADYQLTAPSIGGFVEVTDKGTLEFKIAFTKK